MQNILYKKQMRIRYNAYDYNLLYEGEIWIGKRWKRKRISYKDDLFYEGEYLNGKGKVYDYKDDLLYEEKIMEKETYIMKMVN